MAEFGYQITLVNRYVSEGLDTMSKQLKTAASAQRTLGNATRESHRRTQDLLTSFTKFRWMLVNVAMVSGAVYGLGKLVMASENTRLELVKLSVASGESFDTIQKGVMVMRGETAASNEELIQSFQELAKAGFSFTEQMNIMQAATGASVIGFASLKDTVQAISTTLRQFDIDTSQAADVAYKMAAVANEGRVDIGTLGDALKFSGAIAKQTGTSYEELAASVAVLSNKGLEYSQIGRGQRQVLLSMLSPSNEAIAVMHAYGIQVKDSEGNVKSFTEIIDELDRVLGKLTDAEKQNIIGKLFPANAVSIVLESMGKTNDEVKDLATNLENLGQGAAIDAMRVQTEKAITLAGAWENAKLKLQSYIDTLIQMGAERVDISDEELEAKKARLLAMDEKAGVLSDATKEYIKNIKPSVGFEYNTASTIGTAGLFPLTPTYGVTKNDWNLLNDIEGKLVGPYVNAQNKAGDAAKERTDAEIEGDKTVGAAIDDLVSRQTLYSDTYDVAKGKLDEYNANVQTLTAGLTDQAKIQEIVNQYTTDYIKILEVENPAVAQVFQSLLNSQEKAEKSTVSLSDMTWEYQLRIKELERELRDVSSSLESTRDQIEKTNESISKILSRRWTISGISETEIGHILSMQELELKKAQFATLGLGSAEDFLRNASVITADQLDDQTDAIRRLTDAAASGQDRFEAWKTALEETIRALLITSQDLDKDVTEVVKNAQMDLLSITDYQGGGGSQFSAMEQNLNALQLAQEIFFGSEQENLQYSEQLREDRLNGVNTSAEQAIFALESERASLETLMAAEQAWISQQKAIQAEIDINRQKIDELTEAWHRNKNAMQSTGAGGGSGGGFAGSLAGRSNVSVAYYKPDGTPVYGSGAGGIKYSGGSTPSDGSMTATDRKVQSSPLFIGSRYRPAQDFVFRPGSAPMYFDPKDTLVGVQNTGKLSGGTNIGTLNINIPGNKTDPKALAIEVKRQIASLA